MDHLVSDRNALIIAALGKSYDRFCDHVDGQRYLGLTTRAPFER